MLVRSFDLVERLAARVALDDARHHELGGLERREALAALQAFAAAANLLPSPASRESMTFVSS